MTTPNRRQSFKVQPGPVPVPPSLVSSPYLSPSSMFVKEYAFPRVPAGNQDSWLMDQVPQQQKPGAPAQSAQTKPAASAAQPAQAPAQAAKPAQKQPPKS